MSPPRNNGFLVHALGVMNTDDLRELIEDLAEEHGFLVEKDTNGEIIIRTGLTENKRGDWVSDEEE